MKKKPRIVVVGLGEYFKKIKGGICENFEPILLVDNRSSDDIGLLAEERDIFRQISYDNIKLFSGTLKSAD